MRGRLIAHKTEECDPRIRQKNVEKMRKKNALRKQRSMDHPTGLKKRRREASAGAAQLECKNCKAAGRKHWHDPKNCNYAPGGAWYGLKGDRLKEAQRKTYQEAREAKASKTLGADSSRKYRAKPIKKMRASALKSIEGSGKPYWMLKCHAAEQHPTQFDRPISDSASAVHDSLENPEESTGKDVQYYTKSPYQADGVMHTRGVSFSWNNNQWMSLSQLCEQIKTPPCETVTDAWVETTLASMPTPGVSKAIGSPDAIVSEAQKMSSDEGARAKMSIDSDATGSADSENTAAKITETSAVASGPLANKKASESAAANAAVLEHDSGKDPLLESESETTEEYEVSEETDLNNKVQKYLAENPEPKATNETNPSKEETSEVIVISDSDSEDNDPSQHVCHMMKAARPMSAGSANDSPEEKQNLGPAVSFAASTGPVEILLVAADQYGSYLHCYPFKCYLNNNGPLSSLFECAESVFPCSPGSYYLMYRGRILRSRDKVNIEPEFRKPAPIFKVCIQEARPVWKAKLRALYSKACNQLGYARGPENPHQYTNPLGLDVANRPAEGWEIEEAEEVPAEAFAAAGWPVPTTQLRREEVCVIHMWGAGRRLMTIPYTSTHPLKPLLRALSTVYQKHGWHFVLKTTAQLLDGVRGRECLGGRDTLTKIGMPHGGIVNASYLKHRPPNQPPFLLNPTDAWRTLQRHGCSVPCSLAKGRSRRRLYIPTC